jgi:hypothetical protein
MFHNCVAGGRIICATKKHEIHSPEKKNSRHLSHCSAAV